MRHRAPLTFALATALPLTLAMKRDAPAPITSWDTVGYHGEIWASKNFTLAAWKKASVFA
jgi:hypothetical protein